MSSEPGGFPLLRNLNALEEPGLVRERLERRYRRLCAAQAELGRLNFKQAKPGASLEDLVFQAADFGAYRKIAAPDYRLFFEAGLEDFPEAFFIKNFRMSRQRAGALIRGSFEQEGDFFRCLEERPLSQALLFPLLRALQTSLDWLPLAGRGELMAEMEALPGLGENPAGACRALILSLDQAQVPQRDGEITRLFIDPGGGLSGVFRPGGKPWTVSLIPPEEF